MGNKVVQVPCYISDGRYYAKVISYEEYDKSNDNHHLLEIPTYIFKKLIKQSDNTFESLGNLVLEYYDDAIYYNRFFKTIEEILNDR